MVSLTAINDHHRVGSTFEIRLGAVDVVGAVSAVARTDAGRVAIRVAGGGQLTFGGVDHRSNRLARAVQRYLPRAQQLAIVCCSTHLPDCLVAIVAACKIGLVPRVIHPRYAVEALTKTPAALVLACEEGAVVVRESAVRTILIGDAEGVIWWRAAELRESWLPLRQPPLLLDLAPLNHTGIGPHGAVPHGGAIGIALAALAAGRMQVVVPGVPAGAGE